MMSERLQSWVQQWEATGPAPAVVYDHQMYPCYHHIYTQSIDPPLTCPICKSHREAIG